MRGRAELLGEARVAVVEGCGPLLIVIDGLVDVQFSQELFDWNAI